MFHLAKTSTVEKPVLLTMPHEILRVKEHWFYLTSICLGLWVFTWLIEQTFQLSNYPL